jgi:hypothetical protein
VPIGVLSGRGRTDCFGIAEATMFAQRDEAHNGGEPGAPTGTLADTAVRVRVRWLPGVFSAVRVFIGYGVLRTPAGVFRRGSADE